MTQPSFDSFRAKPYQDSGKVWTVGYGSVISADQAEQMKSGITQDTAKKMFQNYVDGLVKKLSACPLAGFQQWQYDAIICLSYNLGFEQFHGSDVYKQLIVRNGNLSAWLLYVHDSRGHFDEGLLMRRMKELKLFVYGLYS